MDSHYVTINPCVCCQPLGAIMAFRGVENSMTLLHGSQGCSTYMRLHLCHHYREPLDVASSALNEKEAIYGGERNLKKGLKNVIDCYDPQLIGVATTCLAETIGDDAEAIVDDFKTKHSPPAHIVTVSTPSYNGSHTNGFNQTCLALVKHFAQKGKPNQKLNIITSASLSCEDIRHLKQIMADFNQEAIILPDYSQTFEAPFSNSYSKIPAGGTTFSQLEDSANSIATISLNSDETQPSAGVFLEKKFGVKNYSIKLPIGLEETDKFLGTINKITGLAIPEKYLEQRGRLLDAFVDAHRYTFEIKTAICGDADLVYGLTILAQEMGLRPVPFINPHDFDEIHQSIKENNCQLIIGPSSAQFIAEAENIPLIRVGFPIHDRVGAQRKLSIGYAGAMQLVDEIANTILEHHAKF